MNLPTFEYIKLNGRLIAIDSNHTKKIFNITRLRVLFRPNRIGYRNDKYLSIEIVQRCIMLAVQNKTSKHIQTRQCSDCNGKYPGNEIDGNNKFFNKKYCNLKNLCMWTSYMLQKLNHDSGNQFFFLPLFLSLPLPFFILIFIYIYLFYQQSTLFHMFTSLLACSM